MSNNQLIEHLLNIHFSNHVIQANINILVNTIFYVYLDLSEIMSNSRDWDELVWAWEGWRNASGRQMPEMYTEFAALQNVAAEMNGITRVIE